MRRTQADVEDTRRVKRTHSTRQALSPFKPVAPKIALRFPPDSQSAETFAARLLYSSALLSPTLFLRFVPPGVNPRFPGGSRSGLSVRLEGCRNERKTGTIAKNIRKDKAETNNRRDGGRKRPCRGCAFRSGRRSRNLPADFPRRPNPRVALSAALRAAPV